MTLSITDSAIKAAMDVLASSPASTQEKIQMLIEMAQGFQKKPKAARDLWNAVSLYNQARDLCTDEDLLWKARANVGMASTLKAIPDVETQLLLEAKERLEEAIPILQQLALPEEVAEAQMNLGLVLQSLVPFNLARVTDSIQVYHQALQVFTCQNYPQEYAILHNNIAIAYLSIPVTSEQQYLYQGLAVQTFEEALKHIRLIDHPREYAMLHNNLGNALQYLPSTHPIDNIIRAIAAYDEALKVRDRQDTPVEYANTIANKANALLNLPDDLDKPESGNPQNIAKANAYYEEAVEIFTQYGQIEQVQLINELKGIC